MANNASAAADMPSLKHEYNKHSFGDFLGHVVKHVVVMGAMMGVIGLASPAFAATPMFDPLSTGFTGGGPTVGDLIVQTVHGAGEMLNMIVDTFTGLFSIGGDVMANVVDGNLAPSTWDSVVMSHGGDHMMAEGASHAGHAMSEGATHAVAEHAAGGAHSGAFDEWLRNAHASGELPYALEDSEAMGITLEEHMMNEYGHEGH